MELHASIIAVIQIDGWPLSNLATLSVVFLRIGI